LLVATEKITGGIYGQKIKVSGPLELARLAESFNSMSHTLDQKQQESESHVTMLEQVNRDLQLAREEAVRSEKMASVGLLAAGTAHEIGTPLASVMGYAEILSQELERDSVQSDYVRRITDGCNRIDRIVRGLLEYARPKQAAYEPIDLTHLLKRTIELLQHQGGLKGVQFKVIGASGVPLIMVDPHQLQQVLINLLINANDAMPDGGSLELVFRHAPYAPILKLDVRDSGKGISSEHLNKLFDPFFTTKDPGQGTGLGLAISARIIESFGGWISVQSVPGEGSCFTLHLPVKECVNTAMEQGQVL
jgi:signal transduction histidine kinase